VVLNSNRLFVIFSTIARQQNVNPSCKNYRINIDAQKEARPHYGNA
jgi:hypothetical protein